MYRASEFYEQLSSRLKPSYKKWVIPLGSRDLQVEMRGAPLAQCPRREEEERGERRLFRSICGELCKPDSAFPQNTLWHLTLAYLRCPLRGPLLVLS